MDTNQAFSSCADVSAAIRKLRTDILFSDRLDSVGLYENHAIVSAMAFLELAANQVESAGMIRGLSSNGKLSD